MIKLKSRITYTIVCLLLLPTFSLASGPGDKPAMPAPKADVFTVEAPLDLPITLTYPAQIKSFEMVSVVARASGILIEKHFVEGQKVNKGDLLYSIEDDVYLAKLNVAKASLQIRQAALNNATRSWERTQNLFKSKTVSEDSRDTARSVYEQALASLSLAKANLQQVQIDFNHTKVIAPISGVVGLKQVDVGDFVSANPPMSLIEITQNNTVHVEFSMPLRDYVNIKNSLWTTARNGKISVLLEIDNIPANRGGEVDFMDVNINQSTSTVKMRAVVENSDGYVMPGAFVRVVLNNIVQKGVITVPQKAVLQNPLGTIVFIVDQGHVAVKPVILGNETGDKYVIAGGPLVTGDQVIVNNFFRLKPGGEVQIDNIINAEGQ